jgi:hypothetical protein
MAKSNLSLDKDYLSWLLSQSMVLSTKEREIRTKEIKKLVKKDLDVQLKMDVKENTLFHKYHELRDWLPKQKISDLRWVERLIWKPMGKSDFRRIEPELIFVDGHYEIDSINIWGESQTDIYESADPLAKHWEILRRLVSRARYDRFPARTLNFLVRDKVTKTYLGVISITSDMLDLTERNKSIGADIGKFSKDGFAFNITVNGQTIVPTQPFGSAYLGGKLLALLCLSDVVSNTWKQIYGETIVGVTTTSLYGDTGKDGRTQYDGLTPYWKNVGQSKGSAPVKMTDVVYEQVAEWIRLCYPEQYYRDAVKLNSHSNAPKDSKNKLQRFAYKQLGLASGSVSLHKRNIYFSRLYKNTDEYIKKYIDNKYDSTIQTLPVERLEKAFDNSVEKLTEHWRYGYATDTTTSPKHLVKKYGQNIRRLVKGRVDEKFKNQRIPTEGIQVEWYEKLGNFKNWEQAKKKYQNSNED